MGKKKKYYTRTYFQERDILPTHLAQTLTSILKKRGVNRVLDVGCGTGKLVKFLKRAGFKAVGCDNSEEAIKISGQIKASATNLPFADNSFEAITAISLIEHLGSQEAEKFFQETRRVLTLKGYFFLITPNLLSLLKLAKGKKWFAYRDPTHVQFYSPLSLPRVLKKHGFTQFRFRFKPDPKTPADWPFSFLPLPQNQHFHYFFNLALIYSPLAYFRDSFWMLCQKEKQKLLKAQ